MELRGIVKHFPGVVANDGVNLQVQRGEVLALLGENGAGKTTLMNILSGLYQPDSGEIWMGGHQESFRSPRDAIRAGIGMVHQHFNLVDAFTVAENVIIGLSEPKMSLNLGEVENALAELGRRYGLRVDPNARVWQLSVGEQQRAEILKMLYRDAELLILDEPTAVLAPQEVKELTDVLRQMAAAGRSILYISHKLQEVLGVADRITVLRDGRDVATLRAADVDEKELMQLLMGESKSLTPTKRKPRSAGQVHLGLDQVHVLGDRGNEAVRGFSLDVYEGEVLGLAGIAGNGQRELAEAIVGLRRVESGAVRLLGQEITNWPVRRVINAGLSFIPENRMGMGLIPDLDLFDNVIIKGYRRPPLSHGPFLDRRQIHSFSDRVVKDFHVRVADLDEPVWKLSGGNLQRLLLGREISTKPRVLVAANPTRGLDVQATQDVRRLLLEQAAEGAAILLISEDLDELLSVSDRVAVIYDGQMVGVMDSSGASQDRLGMLMMGTGSAGEE